MHLYQHTEILRTTLTQEAKIILPAIEDGDAPKASYRDVQILVPDGSPMYVAVDQPIQRGFDEPIEGGIGPNRNYKLPVFPAGQAIKFRLLPQQYLIGCSDEGLIFATIIVEYLREQLQHQEV